MTACDARHQLDPGAGCGSHGSVSTDPDHRLRQALASPSSSDRLQAALTAGTTPDPRYVEALIEQCAVEPDFSVRETLTWALMRHPGELTVPLLLDEVAGGGMQARTQALHTLSKIGDPRGWEAITPELLRAADDDLARTAWRVAVVLAPEEQRAWVAGALASQLGTGGRTRQRSLSRVLVSLGDAAMPALDAARDGNDLATREHAVATQLMVDDPEAGFDEALFEARKVVALKDRPVVGSRDEEE